MSPDIAHFRLTSQSRLSITCLCLCTTQSAYLRFLTNSCLQIGKIRQQCPVNTRDHTSQLLSRSYFKHCYIISTLLSDVLNSLHPIDRFYKLTQKQAETGTKSMSVCVPVAYNHQADLVTERERQLTTGKQAERTKCYLQCPICRSAIGQASCLI